MWWKKASLMWNTLCLFRFVETFKLKALHFHDFPTSPPADQLNPNDSTSQRFRDSRSPTVKICTCLCVCNIKRVIYHETKTDCCCCCSKQSEQQLEEEDTPTTCLLLCRRRSVGMFIIPNTTYGWMYFIQAFSARRFPLHSVVDRPWTIPGRTERT